jgi:hypothetical protein
MLITILKTELGSDFAYPTYATFNSILIKHVQLEVPLKATFPGVKKYALSDS